MILLEMIYLGDLRRARRLLSVLRDILAIYMLWETVFIKLRSPGLPLTKGSRGIYLIVIKIGRTPLYLTMAWCLRLRAGPKVLCDIIFDHLICNSSIECLLVLEML